MMKQLLLLLLLFSSNIFAQNADSTIVESIEEASEETPSELIEQTFQSTRIVSGHSVECLRKNVLEFRVEHRFGDFAGSQGGIQTLFELTIQATSV